jgi:UDP-N-acetylglucosamine 4,6-dehydratase
MSGGILITGGTGSFGRALAKRLIGSHYDRIVIYSRDEHKQEQMERELGKQEQLRYFIGDIRDKDRLRLAMQGCWDIIHTAAMKIVPTAEYNPMECIKTNVIGAQNLIDIALENLNGTKRILALSTDKAVNPLNLYGASKLCAEKLFLAANNLAGHHQAVFSVVRYGNVANSNGSVIKVFKDQLTKGETLTITHEDMTRYWITLDEAVSFVRQSLGEMQGGEVFIPDMPSFNVLSLALAMSDRVRTIGIRPGEKIHEQIDQDRFSNTNDKWLHRDDLRNKLEEMGII